MVSNKQLFSGKADDYFAARPGYPEALVNWMFEKVGDVKVADIGAGTGIFTLSLLKKFSSVAAVEPNADMRAKFSCYLPDVQCIDGCAEATKLEASSIGLVTCAQAFHWFDEDKFKTECRRILSDRGKIAIVWNTSVKTDFAVERDEVCKAFCPRFAKGYAGKRSVAEGDIFLREQYLEDVEYETFDNFHVMDKEAFSANMSSRSYAPCRGSAEYTAFMEKLHAVFDRYAVDGKVTEVLASQVYLGRIKE